MEIWHSAEKQAIHAPRIMGTILYEQNNDKTKDSFPMTPLQNNYLPDGSDSRLLTHPDPRNSGLYNNYSGVPVTPHVEMSKPRSKGAEWRTVWYEFSQSTTLHGCSRITDGNHYTIRR